MRRRGWIVGIVLAALILLTVAPFASADCYSEYRSCVHAVQEDVEQCVAMGGSATWCGAKFAFPMVLCQVEYMGCVFD